MYVSLGVKLGMNTNVAIGVVRIDSSEISIGQDHWVGSNFQINKETTMTDIVLDIDTEGDVHCLYTDEIDLFKIGVVTDVRKASNVEFNEEDQCWEVLSLDGKVLYTNSSREAAIEWEISAFSPDGTHYEPITSSDV